MKLLMRLFREEDGQGLAEYALILVFIAVVCVLVLTGLGTQIKAVLNKVIEGLGGTAVS